MNLNIERSTKINQVRLTKMKERDVCVLRSQRRDQGAAPEANSEPHQPPVQTGRQEPHYLGTDLPS